MPVTLAVVSSLYVAVGLVTIAILLRGDQAASIRYGIRRFHGPALLVAFLCVLIWPAVCALRLWFRNGRRLRTVVFTVDLRGPEVKLVQDKSLPDTQSSR